MRIKKITMDLSILAAIRRKDFEKKRSIKGFTPCKINSNRV
jgi:hypothetical protein